MSKRSWVRGMGYAVTGLALGAFVALPALAEPPSHGFKHHPVLGTPTNNHKPHAPHPVLGVPTNNHKPHAPHPVLGTPTNNHKPHAPHPVLNVPTNNHAPHVPHKPHPELNPFAP